MSWTGTCTLALNHGQAYLALLYELDDLQGGCSTHSRYNVVSICDQCLSSCVPDRKHNSHVGYVIDNLRVE